MKKIVAPIAALLLFIACHKKSVPAVTDRTEHPAPPVVTKVDTPAHSAADLAAGNVIYTTKCIRCHIAKPVDNWTAAQWQPILKSMIPKARLDSLEKTQLTAYVNQNAKK